MVIVYDGECPFCKSYVRLMALKQAVGDVELVDARSLDKITRELTAAGYDLNEGMAAIYGEDVYYGSDAVTLISTLTQTRGLLGRAVAWTLRDPNRAHRIYPMLKLGRRLVLRLLGKPPL